MSAAAANAAAAQPRRCPVEEQVSVRGRTVSALSALPNPAMRDAI